MLRSKLARSVALLGVLCSAAAARADTLNYTGSLQTYTVPTTGTYTITAAGAQGGFSTYANLADSANPVLSGGLGAQVSGSISLTAGEVLQIVVAGQGGGHIFAGGGGGGTFVYIAGQSDPLLVAGGGAGAGIDIVGEGGLATEGGTSGIFGVGGTGYGGTARYQYYNDGSAGGGWLGDGAASLSGPGGSGPASFAGGSGPIWGEPGGYGGGGNGGDGGAGGGGGYSGGAGGVSFDPPGGGGGGSYINASFFGTTSLGGINAGNGFVTLDLQTRAATVPLPRSAYGGFGLLLVLAIIGALKRRSGAMVLLGTSTLHA